LIASSRRRTHGCAGAADDRRPVTRFKEVEMHRRFASVRTRIRRFAVTLAAGVAPRGPSAARSERAQGTVEYVALILLVALMMAGVVAAMKGFKTDQGRDLGEAILAKMKEAVRKVQF
jgi:hypothetical protein